MVMKKILILGMMVLAAAAAAENTHVWTQNAATVPPTGTCGTKPTVNGTLANAKPPGIEECVAMFNGLVSSLELDKMTPSDLSFNITKGVNTISEADCNDKKILDQAKECYVKAFVINNSDRDWKNTDHTAPVSKAQGAAIPCTSSGIATLDYEACNDFATHAAVADVAQNVAGQVQKMDYQLKSSDAAAKAAQSTSATAGLTSQQTSLQQQQDIVNQQAIMESGKLALLWNDFKKMPTIDEVLAKCDLIKTDNRLHISKESCKQIVQNNQTFFLQNQKAKDAMKTMLIAIGGKAATDLLMADMLGKQADQVGSAIAAVNGFAPIAPALPGSTNLMTNFCQANPSDAQCLTGGLNRTFDAAAGNVIDFGVGGAGTIYSPGTAVNPLADATVAPSGTTAKGDPVGSMGTNSTALNQPGGLMNTSSAAQLDNKPGTGGGGGGGGGAPGGGSGGGGGAGPAAGGAGGVQSAIAGRAPSYGGGGGSLSMMGGFGINKPSGKVADSGNPFGKMFDKAGPKADGTMNFRGPASVGNQKDNLFEMITKRYNNVASDKRLNEYELGK
jgi:hypothetical protein